MFFRHATASRLAAIRRSAAAATNSHARLRAASAMPPARGAESLLAEPPVSLRVARARAVPADPFPVGVVRLQTHRAHRLGLAHEEVETVREEESAPALARR